MSRDVAPFRVGYLDEGAGSESRPLTVLVREMLAFRFDEAREAGEIDRPVEVVERRGVGLPHGTAKAVCDAWHALADDGALVIIGPRDLIGILRYDQRREGSLKVGDRAPDVLLASLDGAAKVRLLDRFSGRPLVIVFGSFT